MRHIDYLLEGWSRAEEPEAVQRRLSVIADQVDRCQIYLELVHRAASDPAAIDPEAIDPAVVFADMFAPGWLYGRRWRLRDALGGLIWAPLADDQRRPLVVFCHGRLGAFSRQLLALESARLAAEPLMPALEAIADQDQALVRYVRERLAALEGPPSAWRCPSCGSRYVEQETFFGGVQRLGCRACAAVESAREDSAEWTSITQRWRAP